MKILNWFWKILLDERGQVPAEGEPQPDSGEGDTPAPDAPHPDPEVPQPAKPEDFLSESRNRAEVMALINSDQKLKQAYGWMQSAYNKKISGRRELEEKASMVDRFYSDPQFATQTIQQWAAQNGYSLTRGQAQAIAREQTGAPVTTGANGVPSQYVEMAKRMLPPELSWMAESQAAVAHEIGKSMFQDAIKPYQDKAQEFTKVQRERDYDKMAKELSTAVPGWEEHEDEMSELLDFISSPDMSHEKFGSKLRILFDIVTSNASSVAEATKRMSAAARNKGSSSRNKGSSDSNVDQRIRDAAKKNINDAWKLASDHAEATLQRQGGRVP